MLVKALDIKLNLISLNLTKGEHLTSEFQKINPQRTVPTLVDGDLVLWESKAILMYLAQKYGKDDSLYPKDAEKQALVNQRLFFEMGTLFPRFYDYFIPQLKVKIPDDLEKFKKLEDAAQLFDSFLSSTKYAGGETLTIADYAFFATWSSLEACKFDSARFANITRWYDLCKKTLTGSEENDEGFKIMKQLYEQKP